MSGEIIERRTVKSWHGLEFEIVIWSNWWAKIGFMRHPQLANFLMRYGLPEKERVKMEALHEFGHVQTFPIVLIYYLPFLFLEIPGWVEFIIITAGMLLFWEILAEGYVVIKYSRYFEIYRKKFHPLYFIFWIITIGASAYPFALI